MVPFDLECVWLVHEVVFKEWNDREARGGGKKKLREARGGSIFFCSSPAARMEVV